MKKPLILVALILFVAAGCNQNASAPVTPGQSTGTEESQLPAENQNADSDKDNNFMVIKEWGVQLTKPAGLANLSYKYNSRESNRVILTTAELENLYRITGENTCFFGALVRAKTIEEITLDYNTVKVGDYYYYLVGPQEVCSQNAQIVTTLSAQGKVLFNENTLKGLQVSQ